MIPILITLLSTCVTVEHYRLYPGESLHFYLSESRQMTVPEAIAQRWEWELQAQNFGMHIAVFTLEECS